MSSRSPYSLLKIYKHFLKDFELEKNKKMLPGIKFQNGAQIQRSINIFLKILSWKKIKKMLPSIKFQNGAQIQDGRKKVFIV
jgi:hypothetical protein